LPALLHRLRVCYPELAILVVDDGSRDRTREVSLAQGVKIVSHPFNLGYGAALQTGYKYALAHGYCLVVQMDGDGQHEVEDLARLLKPVSTGGCDFALGSRYLGQGNYQASFARSLGRRLFGYLASRLTRQVITDPTSGFQVMNRKVLEIFVDDHFPEDYPDADALMLLHYSGLKIKEIPVTMHAPEGKSMHAGWWRPLFYIAKMLLAMLVMYSLKGRLLRREPPVANPQSVSSNPP
jgi:glycosyltransferase involved in cell wall biosynthesis